MNLDIMRRKSYEKYFTTIIVYGSQYLRCKGAYVVEESGVRCGLNDVQCVRVSLFGGQV